MSSAPRVEPTPVLLLGPGYRLQEPPEPTDEQVRATLEDNRRRIEDAYRGRQRLVADDGVSHWHHGDGKPACGKPIGQPGGRGSVTVVAMHKWMVTCEPCVRLTLTEP